MMGQTQFHFDAHLCIRNLAWSNNEFGLGKPEEPQEQAEWGIMLNVLMWINADNWKNAL